MTQYKWEKAPERGDKIIRVGGSAGSGKHPINGNIYTVKEVIFTTNAVYIEERETIDGEWNLDLFAPAEVVTNYEIY